MHNQTLNPLWTNMRSTRRDEWKDVKFLCPKHEIPTLTQEEYEIIMASWKIVFSDLSSIADFLNNDPPRICSYAYSILFAEFPELKSDLFSRYPKAHWTKKMFIMISSVIQNLDFPEGLAEVLPQIGEKHRRYGVKREHYVGFCVGLVEAIRLLCMNFWSDAEYTAWSKGLTIVASMMQGDESESEETYDTEQEDGSRQEDSRRRSKLYDVDPMDFKKYNIPPESKAGRVLNNMMAGLGVDEPSMEEQMQKMAAMAQRSQLHEDNHGNMMGPQMPNIGRSQPHHRQY